MAAVRFRIIVFQTLRYRRDLVLGLLTSHARLEEYVSFYPAGAAVFQFIAGGVECLLHRRWYPKLE